MVLDLEVAVVIQIRELLNRSKMFKLTVRLGNLG